jgi:hypothetical protein
VHAHRETSILELPKDSEQFRFLRAARLTNFKDSVGLILVKVSVMRVFSVISATIFPQRST